MSRTADTVATAEAGAGRSILERVRRDLGGYSAAERRAAGTLVADYPLPGLETVARFAARAGTSGPTILRFVQRLGFASYAQFQDALRAEIKIRLQGPLARYGDPDDTAATGEGDLCSRVSAVLRDNIDAAQREMSREDLDAVVAQLCDPNRAVFCIGGRFSWLLATYMHHYLRELRPSVRAVRDGNAGWADYLVDVRPGDVVVAFDFRRYQADVLEFAKGAAQRGAEVILVTDIWYSPIAAHAAVVIPCPVTIPSAFDSGTSGLAVVEILIAGVVERMGDRSRARIVELEELRQSYGLGS